MSWSLSRNKPPSQNRRDQSGTVIERPFWSRTCSWRRPALTFGSALDAIFLAVIAKARGLWLPDPLVLCLSLGRTVFLCNIGTRADFLDQGLYRGSSSIIWSILYATLFSPGTLPLRTLFAKFDLCPENFFFLKSFWINDFFDPPWLPNL